MFSSRWDSLVIGGMHELFAPYLLCLSCRDEAFSRRTVPGCKNDVGLGTEFHTPDDFRKNFSSITQDRNALSKQLPLSMLVRRGTGWHPDTPTGVVCRLQSHFSGIDIHPVAMSPVHAQAAEAGKIGKVLTYEVHPGKAAPLIRLEHHRAVACFPGIADEGQLVNGSGLDIRYCMNMKVTPLSACHPP